MPETLALELAKSVIDSGAVAGGDPFFEAGVVASILLPVLRSLHERAETRGKGVKYLGDTLSATRAERNALRAECERLALKLDAAIREQQELEKDKHTLECVLASERGECERLRAMVALGCDDDHRERILRAEADLAALRDHLIWVLPMAKGYVAAHPVGNNRAIVSAAETAARAPEDKK